MIVEALSTVTRMRDTRHETRVSYDPCLTLVYRDTGGNVTKIGVRNVIYSEMNPNFKSWFYDVIFEEFGTSFSIDVLVMRKYLPALLRSLYETGFFTVKDGYSWMETATSVNSLISPVVDDETALTAEEKIMSYILNFEAFAERVSDLYRSKARFLPVRAEELFSPEGCLEFLQDRLGVHISDETRRAVGQIMDKRKSDSTGEKVVVSRISLAKSQQVVESYLRRYRDARIWLPNVSLSLEKFPGFHYEP